MKLLHIADVHLGATFKGVNQGRLLRERIKRNFSSAIDIALKESIPFFLIAGDLFHTSNPSESLIKFVVDELKRLTAQGINVILVAGTHEKDLYLTNRFPNIDGVYIFTKPEWEQYVFKDYDITFYGISGYVGNPFNSFSVQGGTKYNVAILHASLSLNKVEDTTVIDLSTIRGAGLDYVALGHWHKMADYSQGNTRVWYAGALEPISIDDTEAGYMLVINLDSEEVIPKKVSPTVCETVEVDVTGMKDLDELSSEILKNSGDNVRRKVVLKGLLKEISLLDIEELKEELRLHFMELQIDQKITFPTVDMVKTTGNLFVDKFIEIMQKEIENEEDENKKEIKQMVLQVGIGMLKEGMRK